MKQNNRNAIGIWINIINMKTFLCIFRSLIKLLSKKFAETFAPTNSFGAFGCQAHLEKEEEKGKRREAKFYGEKYITTSMKKIKHKIRTWKAIRSLVLINVKSSWTIFARSRRAVRKFLISSCEAYNALAVFLVCVVIPVLTSCTYITSLTIRITEFPWQTFSART